ncbi:hypothetical protein N802_03780 [Knoellia sinensis KCTC 19936]|uniref:Cytochrome b561 bacterial/Ni-hydrogenase domain-containing protein n=1 Tax=Knoellia sinensis KCTC 19936 TaxID=1385520 RepID=A0A0A0J643_9MICO|nr:cytochrome b/b6 domain-containing protein [Knoellia sinensis]KGN31497.1 hypothetical protein N802_03780 [Knoellia sinensis KCTC 19936]
MHWRNGEHGYGLVSKILHWTTVLAIVAQFWVGKNMEPADVAFPAEQARIEQLDAQAENLDGAARDAARAEADRLEDELDAREDDAEDSFVRDSLNRPTDPSLPLLHVALGVLIMGLGLARVLWRRTGLPPWAPYLGGTARTIAGITEKVLLGLCFVIPASGLLLLFGGYDWLSLHIATHYVFFAAVAVHVGLHLVHARHGHLRRML